MQTPTATEPTAETLKNLARELFGTTATLRYRTSSRGRRVAVLVGGKTEICAHPPEMVERNLLMRLGRW
jgi:hypothetical protein